MASSQKSPSESKSARYEALHARQATLESEIVALSNERDRLISNSLDSADSVITTQLSDIDRAKPDHRVDIALELANKKIRAHIKQLQRYNEIKDIGTQLMGLIAEKRGVRIVEVQQEFGVCAKD